MRRIFVTVLLAFSAAFAQGMGNMQMGTKGMAELDRLSGKNFDIAYMSMMIAHHQGAVQMAWQALKVVKNPQVREAAQGIIRDQNKEIAELTGGLKIWYSTTPSKMYMDMMTADMKPMVDSAVKAMTPMTGMGMGEDKAFLEAMIPHHQSAIGMSKPALTKATKPELKKFTQGVIDAQSKEIKQYQEWLKTL